MARRVLLISYAYPPLAAPESWQSAKAARGLTLAGAEVTVVSAQPRWWHSRDPTLVPYAHRVAEVREVVTPRWIPFVQPVGALRQFPDPMRFMRRRVLRAVDDLDRFDALVTWSQWHSAHLVGLELKRRRPALPWLAHLSDPWVDNPLVARHPLGRAADVRYERAVMAAADVVEMTSPEALAELLARHPGRAGTASVVPHSFDPSLYGDESPSAGVITARYVGAFYGRRTPAPLFDGLERLASTEGIEVELVGSDESIAVQAAARALRPGLVRVRPSVSYLESLRVMRQSDVLLLVDSPADLNVFVASKLIDYLGARRPIVGITPPGAAAEIVRAAGGWVAHPSNPDAIADALVRAFDHARTLRTTPEHQAADSPYSVDHVGRDRYRLLFGP